jgi:hypothetical protein
MPITRTPIVNDDGTGTTGTIFENAWKQELYDQIDAAILVGGSSARLDYTVGGTYHNVGLPAVDVVTIRAVGITATFTGFSSAREGQRVIVRAGGGTLLSLPHLSGSSTYPLANVVSSGPTMIAAGGAAIYLSVNGAWCLVRHEQGRAIRIPYAAANYGGMTVEAGDVKAHDYYLRGNVVTLNIDLQTVAIPSASYVSISGLPYSYSPDVRRSGVWSGGGVASAMAVVNVEGANQRIAAQNLNNVNFGVMSDFALNISIQATVT